MQKEEKTKVMKNQDYKTREQLLKEIDHLSAKVDEFERSESQELAGQHSGNQCQSEIIRMKILLESSLESQKDLIILSLDNKYQYQTHDHSYLQENQNQL